jgi:ribosomal-protein-alanine N-acetyltransferase
MNIEIRKIDADSAKLAAELEKMCFSEPWSENALAEELSNENSHFLVAVSDEVMGYIGVQEICSEAYITNVAVFGKYRKFGIGRALLKAACDGAKGRGCEFITLEVRVSNTAAIALYESEGFEKVGIRKNFYASPVEDGAIYTKYFSGGISE